LSKIITRERTYFIIIGLYFIELLTYSLVFFSGSFDDTVVLSTLFFIQIISYIKFLLHSTLTNSFGHSKFAGLCLTTLASFTNMGNNSWLQLKLNGLLGYSTSVGGGLIAAWIIGLFLIPFVNWIQNGEP
jgi:hypothetical protein